VTTSNRKIDLAPDARRDFREILRLTRKQWGEVQRDRYAGKLTGSLERLAQFPDLGERRDDLSLGLRALPLGQHTIFYEVDDHMIRVLRILHVKMDATGLFIP
jgi:toxin ParE1/3/4